MLQQIAQAFSNVMTLQVMGYITLGLFIGYVVGVLPGLSRATAIALLIPITYKLPALAGISFLIGVSKGGNTGSALTAILINVPGEPQSVVTALDGYPLTQQGKAQKALKLALAASVLGDFLATLALIALAQPLASLAVGTGPVELTAILIFAITFIAAVSGASFWKGLIAGFLGLLLAAPRLDMETGQPRLTFGFPDIYDGVPLLAVAIGTLALSEMLVQIDKGWRGSYEHKSLQLKSSTPENSRLTFRGVLQLPAYHSSRNAGRHRHRQHPGHGSQHLLFPGLRLDKAAGQGSRQFRQGAPRGRRCGRGRRQRLGAGRPDPDVCHRSAVERIGGAADGRLHASWADAGPVPVPR